MKTLLLALALLGCSEPSLAEHGCEHATAISCPVTIAAALSSADCSASDGSRYDRFQFSGTAGQTVTIAMSSTAVDALVILLDPANAPVAMNDDAGSSGTDATLTFTLTATGTWTIVANSLAANQGGDYVLSLSSPSCGPPGPRRRSVRTP